jgi:hypothetical protein
MHPGPPLNVPDGLHRDRVKVLHLPPHERLIYLRALLEFDQAVGTIEMATTLPGYRGYPRGSTIFNPAWATASQVIDAGMLSRPARTNVRG